MDCFWASYLPDLFPAVKNGKLRRLFAGLGEIGFQLSMAGPNGPNGKVLKHGLVVNTIMWARLLLQEPPDFCCLIGMHNGKHCGGPPIEGQLHMLRLCGS